MLGQSGGRCRTRRGPDPAGDLAAGHQGQQRQPCRAHGQLLPGQSPVRNHTFRVTATRRVRCKPGRYGESLKRARSRPGSGIVACSAGLPRSRGQVADTELSAARPRSRVIVLLTSVLALSGADTGTISSVSSNLERAFGVSNTGILPAYPAASVGAGRIRLRLRAPARGPQWRGARPGIRVRHFPRCPGPRRPGHPARPAYLPPRRRHGGRLHPRHYGRSAYRTADAALACAVAGDGIFPREMRRSALWVPPPPPPGPWNPALLLP
jgi:hypothetical protein